LDNLQPLSTTLVDDLIIFHKWPSQQAPEHSRSTDIGKQKKKNALRHCTASITISAGHTR